MSAPLDILTRFPNCRVTIGSSRPRPRRPRIGDRRLTKRHGWQVRVQATDNGMSLYRRGRPVLHWVRETQLTEAERREVRLVASVNGAADLTRKPATPTTQ